MPYERASLLCDTEPMAAVPNTRLASTNDPRSDPQSVQVHKTSGAGMEIVWKDGHRSSYSFAWLRDACPCALCDEERAQSGRKLGAAVAPKPGELPMFKAAARPTEVTPVGKYAISFHWNDGHQHGIYSWEFLRDNCPCAECKAADRPE
jgi:DUF971 family protein